MRSGYRPQLHPLVQIWSLLAPTNQHGDVKMSLHLEWNRRIPTTQKRKSILSLWGCPAVYLLTRSGTFSNHHINNVKVLDASLVFVPKPRKKFPASRPTGVTFSTPEAKKHQDVKTSTCFQFPYQRHVSSRSKLFFFSRKQLPVLTNWYV